MTDERTDLIREADKFFHQYPVEIEFCYSLLGKLVKSKETCSEENKKWTDTTIGAVKHMLGLNTVEVKTKKNYLILGNYFPSPKSGKRLATFYCFCPKCKETSNYAVFPNDMKKSNGDPDYNILLDEYTSIDYYERFIKMLKESLKRVGFLK